MDEAKAIKPNLDYPAALTSHLLVSTPHVHAHR